MGDKEEFKKKVEEVIKDIIEESFVGNAIKTQEKITREINNIGALIIMYSIFTLWYSLDFLVYEVNKTNFSMLILIVLVIVLIILNININNLKKDNNKLSELINKDIYELTDEDIREVKDIFIRFL